jgi:hypothetical protein
LNEIISDELTSSPSAVVYEFGIINSPILDIINSSNPAYDFTDEEKIYYIRFVQNDVKILYNFIGINNSYGVGQNQMTQLDLVLVYSSANSDPTTLINDKLDKGSYQGTAQTLSTQAKIYENGHLQIFRKPGTEPNPNNPFPNVGDWCIGYVEGTFINANYLGGDLSLLTSFNI